MKHYCNDGCGSRVDRAGDRCQPCIDKMNRWVLKREKKLGEPAGYILQVSYHIGPRSFATAYLKVPGSSYKEALRRAKRARRELDYFGQFGIADVDIRLGSVYYKRELQKGGC